MTDHPLAHLRGVTKRFGAVRALDGVDLQVRRGELLALLGPNGAGKTTAISLLLGLLRPDAGEVRVFDRPPHLLAARRGIGVMMQESALASELSSMAQVRLAASYYPSPRDPDAALQLAGALSLRDKTYGSLSHGQKRQVQFAVALCGRPRLLFLDEPTVGLDQDARENMWRVMRRLVDAGCGVVLTTHYLEEAESLADRVVVIAAGRILANGSVGDLRTTVACSHIRCVTTLTPEQVGAWQGVETVSHAGGRLSFTTTDPEGSIRRLTLADPTVRELEIRRAGLAEALSALTKEAVQ
jgi:ABC-2 type transport system ATP-binding protein